MAIDKAGAYLAVADHGSGTSTGTGGVEIFQIGSGGGLTLYVSAKSPCVYPNKVLFDPTTSTSGNNEAVYILCSSPEIGTSPPNSSIHYCTMSQLKTLPTECKDQIVPNSGTPSLYNLAIAPGNSYAVVPGISGSDGFLLEFSNPPPTSSSGLPTATFSGFVPSGQVGFVGSSLTRVLLGDYGTSSGSSIGINSCPLISSGSISCKSLFSTSSPDPIAVIAYSAGTALYIPLTGTPVVVGGSVPTTAGVVLSCPVSGTTILTSSCVPTVAGEWPLSVTFDFYSHAFVPNYGSGSVSVYSVGTGGSLTPISTLSVGTNPISVLVR